MTNKTALVKPRAWLRVSNISGESSGFFETQNVELRSESLVPLYEQSALDAAVTAKVAAKVAAEREACIKICETRAADKSPPYKDYENTYLNGWLDASNECGWEIRGRFFAAPDEVAFVERGMARLREA